MRSLILTLICFLAMHASFGQACSNPGQTPATAFPVCGKAVFTQTSVPLCTGTTLPAIHCPNDGVTDRNPYYYKFTCQTAGTLGFVITPKTLAEDYDWELYDVTGINPNNIFTNGNLVVSCNWSGEVGVTGASSAGSSLFICAGSGKALFSSMPQLVVGHDYLLLISHFTNTQSGYTLEFKGGTAAITDTTTPRLSTATSNCAGDLITVALKKKIKCSSLAADGSDFMITNAAGVTILGATSTTCAAGQFDADTVRLRLSAPLPAGNYTVGIKNGTDNNTLLDYCDLAMPVTEIANFIVTLNQPTPMDSLAPIGCSPNLLRLVFKKPILCSSIAADGSDFVINGTYPVTIAAVTGNCTGTTTTSILLTLSKALQQKGNFVVQLQRGTDGNTLRDDCNAETPPGSSVAFQVKDTVNADFTYNVQYGCAVDVVSFSHNGSNEVNKWTWKLDPLTSTLQSPQASYSNFSPKNIELIVTNGTCSDTSRTTIVLDNYLTADFTTFADNCPLEPVTFTGTAAGRLARLEWNFGDGGFATGLVTTHVFSQPQRETIYNVQFMVTDSFGCTKTVVKPIKIYSSCIIKVPNAFTPNNDRTNDVLYPLNAVKAQNLEFTVYNRWGQRVFHTTDWRKGWDGTINGSPQQTGTYVWTLRYVDRDTGKRIEQKGVTILIR